MADFDKTLRDLVLDICEQARREVRKVIKSRTLSKALSTRIDPSGRGFVLGRVAVPHYWAIAYHDGRGPVRAKNGKYLVYFRSIEEDPRVKGTATPERLRQVKKLRLAPSTFNRLRREGKIIVTRSVGPAAGNPFFETLNGFSGRIGQKTRLAISRFVVTDLTEKGLLHVRL